MTATEYLEIFAQEELKRSEFVRMLEEQIACLTKYAKRCEFLGDQEEATKYYAIAEEAKWLAIVSAEDEKKQGWEYFEDHH